MAKLKDNKLVTIAASAGLALVAWQLLVGPLNYSLQLFVFAVSMFTIGIPHGAFDYLVEQEIFRRQDSIFSGLTFRLKYLTAILTYGALWYLLPQTSLAAFLVMSAWHFGETDLREIAAWPVTSYLMRLIYGISILMWIIFAHPTESHAIILHLLPANSLTLELWTNAFIHANKILLISGLVLVISLGSNQLVKEASLRLRLLLQLIIILSCCCFLPLLPAFVLYFVGWHSVITLDNIEMFINGNRTLETRLTTAVMIFKALPASLMSISMLLITGYIFKNYAPIFDPLPLLFVFLSLITLPHMLVMNSLFNMGKSLETKNGDM